jgi:hypothetical protein
MMVILKKQKYNYQQGFDWDKCKPLDHFYIETVTSMKSNFNG